MQIVFFSRRGFSHAPLGLFLCAPFFAQQFHRPRHLYLCVRQELEKPSLRLLTVPMQVVLLAKCSKIIQIVIPARKAGLPMIHFEAEGALTLAT
jgi:hypothetical protein